MRIGDEEQNGKQENKNKETGSEFPNPATLDHSVAYDAQGSHGEPILFTLQPTGE